MTSISKVKSKLSKWQGVCHEHHCFRGGRVNKNSAEMKKAIFS